MFLLKRRKDGKFWNNSGDRHTDAWVDDFNTCRPFRSVNALRHSRACYGVHPEWYTPPSPWTDEQRRAHWKTQSAWYRASNAPARRDYFNSIFEIVPVTIKLVLSE